MTEVARITLWPQCGRSVISMWSRYDPTVWFYGVIPLYDSPDPTVQPYLEC